VLLFCYEIDCISLGVIFWVLERLEFWECHDMWRHGWRLRDSESCQSYIECVHLLSFLKYTCCYITKDYAQLMHSSGSEAKTIYSSSSATTCVQQLPQRMQWLIVSWVCQCYSCFVACYISLSHMSLTTPLCCLLPPSALQLAHVMQVTGCI